MKQMMSISEFLSKALEPAKGQRRGQWFVNALHIINPALVNSMIHHDVDPFYDDAKLWAAIKFVKENWEVEQVQSNYTEV